MQDCMFSDSLSYRWLSRIIDECRCNWFNHERIFLIFFVLENLFMILFMILLFFILCDS